MSQILQNRQKTSHIDDAARLLQISMEKLKLKNQIEIVEYIVNNIPLISIDIGFGTPIQGLDKDDVEFLLEDIKLKLEEL